MTSFSYSSTLTSFSSGEVFSVFSLREEGFYSLGLPVLPRMSGKEMISDFSFRNLLPRERFSGGSHLLLCSP